MTACVWAESVTGCVFLFSLLRWGLSRPPRAHQLLLHAADEGAGARSQSGPELQGGPGNLPPSAVSDLPSRGRSCSHCYLCSPPVLPLRGRLAEHPHPRLAVPPGPGQTPPLGGVSADGRHVSLEAAVAAAA